MWYLDPVFTFSFVSHSRFSILHVSDPQEGAPVWSNFIFNLWDSDDQFAGVLRADARNVSAYGKDEEALAVQRSFLKDANKAARKTGATKDLFHSITPDTAEEWDAAKYHDWE